MTAVMPWLAPAKIVLTVDQILQVREWARFDADVDADPDCETCADRGEVEQHTADSTYLIDCPNCPRGGMRT